MVLVLKTQESVYMVNGMEYVGTWNKSMFSIGFWLVEILTTQELSVQVGALIFIVLKEGVNTKFKDKNAYAFFMSYKWSSICTYCITKWISYSFVFS